MNVRTLRESVKLNQSEVAEMMQVRGLQMSQQKLARIESGIRRVSVGEAVLISEALDVRLDDLLDVAFTPEPSQAEAFTLLKADVSQLTEMQLRQREMAAQMLAEYGED